MTRLFSARKKVLGIIGGMGPMASAYFGRLLVEMADVDTDQQHLPTILLNIPEIPDRTAYILGTFGKKPGSRADRRRENARRAGRGFLRGDLCDLPLLLR